MVNIAAGAAPFFSLKRLVQPSPRAESVKGMRGNRCLGLDLNRRDNRFATSLGIGGLIFLLLEVSFGQDRASILEADGIVASLYPDGINQAGLVLRIGKMRRGFERRGFFRIGVLPTLLLQDVRMEFQNPQDPRATLDLVFRHMAGLGSKERLRLSLENVAVQFPGEPHPRLRADSVKLASRGCWEFAGNVHLVFAGESVRARKAQLKVAGEEAGKLILHQRGQAIITDLFEPVLPVKAQHYYPDTP